MSSVSSATSSRTNSFKSNNSSSTSSQAHYHHYSQSPQVKKDIDQPCQNVSERVQQLNRSVTILVRICLTISVKRICYYFMKACIEHKTLNRKSY